jgi:hypothetical protein
MRTSKYIHIKRHTLSFIVIESVIFIDNDFVISRNRLNYAGTFHVNSFSTFAKGFGKLSSVSKRFSSFLPIYSTRE